MEATQTDKPVLLSSTQRRSASADKAVDGIYVPDRFEHIHFPESLLETNPWWRVDLQGIHCIIAVNILNRASESKLLLASSTS